MFGFVSVLLVLSVISGVAWIIHRAYEEISCRMNHVCWIDDTVCPECTDWESYAQFRDSRV